ncbi:hypothetical protein JCM10207_002940 [Rhodosporidiobolus poonsookiae]
MSSLPSEIVLHIFSLAAADSPSTLTSLARLSPSLRDWSRARLYLRPVLRSAEQIALFVRTMQANRFLAATVRTVVFHGREGQPRLFTYKLPVLFRACLWLECVELEGVAVFTLSDFVEAKRLTHLRLTTSTLSDRTSEATFSPLPIVLPSLTHLALTHSLVDASTAKRLFTPAVLPALEVLEVEETRVCEGPGRREAGVLDGEVLRRGLIRTGEEKR